MECSMECSIACAIECSAASHDLMLTHFSIQTPVSQHYFAARTAVAASTFNHEPRARPYTNPMHPAIHQLYTSPAPALYWPCTGSISALYRLHIGSMSQVERLRETEFKMNLTRIAAQQLDISTRKVHTLMSTDMYIHLSTFPMCATRTHVDPSILISQLLKKCKHACLDTRLYTFLHACMFTRLCKYSHLHMHMCTRRVSRCRMIVECPYHAHTHLITHVCTRLCTHCPCRSRTDAGDCDVA